MGKTHRHNTTSFSDTKKSKKDKIQSKRKEKEKMRNFFQSTPKKDENDRL